MLADHRPSAVRASLEMIETIEWIELFGLERRAADKPPIRVGVGIASGDLIAGYTGTRARATYTCVGDTVNLAARLESHTKVVGRAILIDAATRDALPSDVRVEALGPVSFAGKALPVAVFAIASSMD